MALLSELLESIAPRREIFDVQLSDALAALAFLDTAESLRPRLGAVIDWTRADQGHRDLLNEFLGQGSPDKVRAAIGIIVLGYGAFEELLLTIVEKCATSIAEETEFSDLTREFRDEHVYRTGRLLVSHKKKREGVTVIPDQLGRNLGICIDGAEQYSLNTLAFRFEAGVLHCDNIEKLISRLGVDLKWDDVGRSIDLQHFLGEKGVRRCGKEACQRWDSLVSTRNVVSHRGGDTLAISMDELISAVNFCRLFGHAVADAITTTISSKYG